jgi:hypothetical protein
LTTAKRAIRIRYMSSVDPSRIIQRIDELLDAEQPNDTGENIYAAAVETYQRTLTLVTSLYGPRSHQAEAILKAADMARKEVGEVSYTFPRAIRPVMRGTLRAMRGDVEAGLVGNIERRVSGELLADFLGLAKVALADGSDGAKNVAAVLAAATYEDTIRKMGATLAGVIDRPDLVTVVTQLKNAGVLVGAPLSTALSYLKFRNDALHADWTQLTPALVGSCISFTEGLLLQHFS